MVKTKDGDEHTQVSQGVYINGKCGMKNLWNRSLKQKSPWFVHSKGLKIFRTKEGLRLKMTKLNEFMPKQTIQVIKQMMYLLLISLVHPKLLSLKRIRNQMLDLYSLEPKEARYIIFVGL
jgi:predicted glycosyltransferase involved in capsule biosynthesis